MNTLLLLSILFPTAQLLPGGPATERAWRRDALAASQSSVSAIMSHSLFYSEPYALGTVCGRVDERGRERVCVFTHVYEGRGRPSMTERDPVDPCLAPC